MSKDLLIGVGGGEGVAPPGQVLWGVNIVNSYYGPNGLFPFVVPQGVYSICAVTVGRGGYGPGHTSGRTAAGGGGGLSYRNDIPVTPGETLTIDFNAEHVGIRRDAEWLCYAQCSAASRTGGLGGKSLSVIHTGGGNGGLGANNTGSTVQRLGGGGAGGYTSNGGNGGGHNTTQTTSFDGGSGGNYNASFNTCSGGFGVTLLGSRVPGSNGVPVGSPYPPNVNNTSTALRNAPPRGGGRYGGGAAVIYNTTSGNVNGQSSGGVRIIWGEGRSYPYNALDV